MSFNDVPKFILAVSFFKSENGTEPVRDWLRSLPTVYKKTIGEDIKTVQYGWPLGMPLVRKIDTGLWEIRTHLQDGIARIFFTVIDDTMILLHGFIKKSQKTPQDILNTVIKRKKQLN